MYVLVCERFLLESGLDEEKVIIFTRHIPQIINRHLLSIFRVLLQQKSLYGGCWSSVKLQIGNRLHSVLRTHTDLFSSVLFLRLLGCTSLLIIVQSWSKRYFPPNRGAHGTGFGS